MYRKELMALGHHLYDFQRMYEASATLSELAGKIERGQLKAKKEYVPVFRQLSNIIDVMAEDEIRSMLIDYALTKPKADTNTNGVTNSASEQPANDAHSGSVSGESTDSSRIQSAQVSSVPEEVRKE